MERLTERDEFGNADIVGVDGADLQLNLAYEEFNKVTEALNKLAEYEDAEEQGFLLRLPCKVGDAVYHEEKYATIHTGIQVYQITNIMISQNKKGEWTKKYRAMMLLNGRIVDSQLNFSFDDLGKTVFLTQEEAEQALKQMGE